MRTLLFTIVAIIVGVCVAYVAVQLALIEIGQEVVVLHKRTGDGAFHRTRLWIVDEGDYFSDVKNIPAPFPRLKRHQKTSGPRLSDSQTDLRSNQWSKTSPLELILPYPCNCSISTDGLDPSL
ncbi:MAG: hypothetical protein ACE5HC_14630 [Candidatus Binatia bacterium]